jgi:hypothetical protein
MSAEAIQFGSPRYFELLRQYPAWGPFLALGERLTLVWEGQAYAIGESGASEALGVATVTATAVPTASAIPAATAVPSATAIPAATAVSAATAAPTLTATAIPAPPATATLVPETLPEARPAGLWEMVKAWFHGWLG